MGWGLHCHLRNASRVRVNIALSFTVTIVSRRQVPNTCGGLTVFLSTLSSSRTVQKLGVEFFQQLGFDIIRDKFRYITAKARNFFNQL